MKESEIQDFWNSNPCGDMQVGGLKSRSGNYKKFFADYDKFRYIKEKHIIGCLDGLKLSGKRVLEIGLGQGADSEQIIKRGAIWSGLDLTAESVERVSTRLSLHELPYDSIKQGSALQIPFSDGSFDLVFSHGVLHHIPDIGSAQREIDRVLKKGGELVIMVYAKWSINYVLSISVIRRIGLVLLYILDSKRKGIIGQHLDNAKVFGIWNYLRLENFIHTNTDGPLNPYSKVYDRRAVEEDFPNFHVTRTYRRFMHAPPINIGWLPLGSLIGWHLWAHLTPVRE